MKFNTFLNGQHYVINTSTGNHALNLSPLARLTLEAGDIWFPTHAAVSSISYPAPSMYSDTPYNCDGWSNVTIKSNYVTYYQVCSEDLIDLNSGNYNTYTFMFTSDGPEFDPYCITSWDNATTGLFSVCGPSSWDSDVLLYFTLESVHKFDKIYWDTEKSAFCTSLDLDEYYIQENFNYILKFKLVRREEYGEVIIPANTAAGAYVNPGNTVEIYFGARPSTWDDLSAPTSYTMTYLGGHEISEGDEWWYPVYDTLILDPYMATLMVSYIP